MTQEEYHADIQQLAKLSEVLTRMLDETGQDVFEEYCTIYERVVLYENNKKNS